MALLAMTVTLASPLMAQEKPYDYIIKGALVYDGQSSRALRTDVAVSGTEIVSLGELDPAEAHHVIEAEGLVLAPGFIDAHTHSDFNPMVYPDLRNKILQGVATEIIGNCGMSAAPVLGAHGGQIASVWAREGVTISPPTWQTFRDYIHETEYAKLQTNFVGLVGHGNLRSAVMGLANQPASPEQIEEMKKYLKQAMEEGAFGISFGLVYLPGIFAKEEELVALCAEAARRGGICAFHIRSEGSGLLEALGEAIRIGERAGARIQISHLKAAGKKNWNKIEEAFQILEEAGASGHEIVADAYPYTASFAELGVILPDSYYEREDRVRFFQDPAKREDIISELGKHYQNRGMSWESIVIATVVEPKDQPYEGKSMTQIAQETSKDPVTVLVDLLGRNSFLVSAYNFSQSPEVVSRVLEKSYVAVGSDSIADGIRHPHPRAFGSFPKLFREWVREKKTLELGEAIRKMTSLPAKHFGIRNRGLIRPGYYADLVLFDPEKIADEATYESPTLSPQGIRWVFVNGHPALRDGALTNSKKGRFLLRGE